SRSVRDHGDRESDMFFYEFHIFPAVFRKILILFDTADICLPSGQHFQNRFRLLQKSGYREVCRHFSVDLISSAYRDLVKISQDIQNSKSNVCGSLHAAAIFGSNTVKPSHTSGASCSPSVLAAVSASSAELVCFLAENLRYESASAHRAGVRLA